MTEQEEKIAFAEAMISAKMNPLEAGQLVHPGNFNRAAQIASRWHNDAEVKLIIAEIKKAEIEGTGISENEKYIIENLKKIVDGVDCKRTNEDIIRALDKLIEVWGLSKKPQTGPAVQVVVPRVIEIPNHGTDEQWAGVALSQQAGLMSVSRSRH